MLLVSGHGGLGVLPDHGFGPRRISGSEGFQDLPMFPLSLAKTARKHVLQKITV
jgi:hypothetical protein